MTIPRIDPSGSSTMIENPTLVLPAQDKALRPSDEDNSTTATNTGSPSRQAAPTPGDSSDSAQGDNKANGGAGAEQNTLGEDVNAVPVKSPVNPRFGKRLDTVANILEQELEEWGEDRSTDITASLTRQIELIRKLAKESKPDEAEKYESYFTGCIHSCCPTILTHISIK